MNYELSYAHRQGKELYYQSKDQVRESYIRRQIMVKEGTVYYFYFFENGMQNLDLLTWGHSVNEGTPCRCLYTLCQHKHSAIKSLSNQSVPSSSCSVTIPGRLLNI